MNDHREELRGAITDEDLRKVRSVGFKTHTFEIAFSVINSMRYLHALAAELGKPVAAIDTDDIIQNVLDHEKRTSLSDA